MAQADYPLHSAARLVAILAVPLAIAAGFGIRSNAADAPADILAVSDRTNAHVSLAADQGLRGAAWAASTADGATDVYAAISRDGGRTFGRPVRVSTSSDARINGEQPPRIAFTAGKAQTPDVLVMWTAKGAKGTVLLTSRSVDGGRTFSAPAPVPGTDAAPGNRGWESMAADAKGQVHAVWLDHRRAAAAMAAMPAGHQHGAAESGTPSQTPAAKPDGFATAQKSDLYFDTVGDETAPRAISAGVCYCCKTAITFGRANEIYLAWRQVYPGNVRDMAFTMSRDGGATFAEPVRISEDHWTIEGCPEDGPSMTVDGRGHIHVVWPTVVSEGGTQTKALFYAASKDGRSFSARQRLPTEIQANHPQIALAADGSLIVMWDESGGGIRRIVRARGEVGSAGASFTRQPWNDATTGVYPKILATSSGTLVAWTSGQGTSSVIRLARLP